MSTRTFPVRLANTRVPCRALRIALLASTIFFTAASVRIVAADCNENGIDDAQEIAGGTSLDCNGNGVPDECDVVRELAFLTPSFSPCLERPDAIATGDLNGDSALDAIVSGENGERIQALLNSGDGTFVPSWETESDERVLAVEIADLDLDGHGDVIAATRKKSSGGYVLLFFGRGNGNFDAPVFLEVPLLPLALAVVRLDADPSPDLLVAGAYPDRVSVVLGEGDRGFALDRSYPVGERPIQMLIDDFDTDGFLDLLLLNEDSEDLSLLLGREDGRFLNEVRLGSIYPGSLASGDVNLDGLPDLVIASTRRSNYAVRLGRGDGTFEAQELVELREAPSFVELADLDGDLDPELLLIAGPSWDVHVLPGADGASFGAGTSYFAGAAVPRVITADFDGDGVTDILGADSVGGSLTMTRGLSGGALSSSHTRIPREDPEQRSILFAVADLDGDRIDDFVSYAYGPDTAEIELGPGAGVFEPTESVTLQSGLRDLVLGDWNADGLVDIAGAGDAKNLLSVAFATGPARFPRVPQLYPIPSAPSALVSADLNDDGYADLAVTSRHTNEVHVLLSIGADSGFRESVGHLVGEQPADLIAEDLSGDGIVDLATANPETDDVSILIGRGDGTFEEVRSHLVEREPVALDTGDFDGDGALDLAVVHADSARLAVLGGAFGGELRWTLTIDLAAPHHTLEAADLDGDGLSDLALVDREGHRLTILRSEGDRTFEEPFEIPTQLTPSMVLARDVDGDHLLELLLCHSTARTLLTLSNVTRPVDSFDCNRNGVPDRCDIAAGESRDVDSNGVPDECQPDCDANLAPDELEITQGAHTDCDSSGIPDACELASGDSRDCNDNGVPDRCDIASGTSADSNRDGRPDECESDCDGDTIPDQFQIERDPALDCNGNGLLDVCEIAVGLVQDCDSSGVPDGCELEQELSFAGARVLPGIGDQRFLIADLDLDSHPDFISVNYHESRIEIARGGPRGQIHTERDLYDVGEAPIGVAARDVNADGWPDLISSNWLSSNISVLLATGWGEFAAPTHLPLDDLPRDLIVEDLDGDGHHDIVTSSERPSTIRILLGRGDGTFAPALSFPMEHSLISMITADLEDKGVPNLILGLWEREANGEMSILITELRSRERLEVLASVTLAAPPQQIGALDFDEDGALDLVVDAAGERIAVYHGHGDGTLAAPRYAEANKRSWGLATGDFLPSSGGDEFAIGLQDSDRILIYTRHATGRPIPVGEFQLVDDVDALLGADLDNDGRDDLLASTMGTVVTFPGGPDGTLRSANVTLLETAPEQGHVGDLDLDGVPDLVLSRERTSALHVHFLRSNGEPDRVLELEAPSSPDAFVVEDLNHDGLPDIATVFGTSEFIGVFLNRRDRAFSEMLAVPAENGSTTLATADFNGDGHVDLASVDESGNALSILLGDGAGAFAPAATQTGLGATDGRLLAADLDHDGNADLVTWIHDGDQTQVLVYRGWGDGTFRSALRFPAGDEAGDLQLFDVNGDEELDLIARIELPGRVVFLPGAADGSFAEGALLETEFGLNRSVTPGDFDGDGDIDFAVDAGRMRVEILVQEAGGSFAHGPVYQSGQPLVSGGAADVDGDGLVDLVGIAGREELENEEYFFSVLFNKTRSSSSDCDGDGRPDSCEIRDGEEADLDGNGVPDSCDPDCDGDGIPDAFQIASGGSADCNGNAIPDECDLAAGAPDCDQDGALDSCEIHDGEEADCDSSGVPDRCEIASGTAEDENLNDVPDRCESRCLVPGDCSGNQRIDLTDAICVLQALFGGAASEFPCGDGTTATPGNVTLLDWQRDSRVNITDAVGLLLFLFSGGPPHALAVPGDELSGCVKIFDCP